VAPANAGKTEYCLHRLQAVLAADPLAEAWVVLPNRTQAAAFRRRLAGLGVAAEHRLTTFVELYTKILDEAGEAVPIADGPLVHRLVRASIDAVAERVELRHYAAIQRRPGFATALTELIAELKKS